MVIKANLNWLNAKITVLKLGDPKLMDQPVLYTHMGSDLDSGVAVSTARISNAEIRDMPVCFVPANWDGTGLKKGDICIDIEPDGSVPNGVLVLKGRRDENGKTGSATALVVEYFVKDERVRALLATLVELVDTHDANGDPYLTKFPFISLELRMFLNETGLLMFYRAMRITMHDHQFLQFFERFIGGFITMRDKELRTGKHDGMEYIPDLDYCMAVYAHQRMKGLTADDIRPVFRDHMLTGVLKNGDVITADIFDKSESLFMRKMQEADPDEQRLMQPMVDLVHGYMHNRNPFMVMNQTQAYRRRRDMIRFLGYTNLVAGFDGLRTAMAIMLENADDDKHMGVLVYCTMILIEYAGVLYEGLRKNRVAAEEVHALVTSNDPRLAWSTSRQVVMYDNRQINNHRLNDVLANYYGVRGMVMVAGKKPNQPGNGNQIGFRRADGEHVRVDDPSVLAVIQAKGELCRSAPMHWFVHPGHWLVAWGTSKAPAPWPSRVDPVDLFDALEALFVAHPKAA